MSIDFYVLFKRLHRNRPLQWKRWYLREKVLKPGIAGSLRYDQIQRQQKLRRRAKHNFKYEKDRKTTE